MSPLVIVNVLRDSKLQIAPVLCQAMDVTEWIDLSFTAPFLCRVIKAWNDLLEYVRSAVIDLCRVRTRRGSRC